MMINALQTSFVQVIKPVLMLLLVVHHQGEDYKLENNQLPQALYTPSSHLSSSVDKPLIALHTQLTVIITIYTTFCTHQSPHQTPLLMMQVKVEI